MILISCVEVRDVQIQFVLVKNKVELVALTQNVMLAYFAIESLKSVKNKNQNCRLAQQILNVKITLPVQIASV